MISIGKGWENGFLKRIFSDTISKMGPSIVVVGRTPGRDPLPEML